MPGNAEKKNTEDKNGGNISKFCVCDIVLAHYNLGNIGYQC